MFLDIPYNDRKLIFIGEDIYATASRDLIVLKKKDLPTAVHFPEGHPLINVVYVCHPLKQDFYFPIKNYSEVLFLERINEFSYLMECLGATHLELSKSHSKSTEKDKSSKKSLKVKLDSKLTKQQDFKPTKSPYIPNDLLWFPTELKWQKLAEKRLHSSIKTYKELISNTQNEIISLEELEKIKAELKVLLPKVGLKYSSKSTIKKSSLEKLEWIAKVEFADVNKLTESSGKQEQDSTSNPGVVTDSHILKLEKYKEDVSFMLEDDGVIDVTERKFLNKKIKKYGISKADALAIENQLLNSKYSENEKKYIEELKEILEDGLISDIERKILNRYAKKFNISVEKQAIIDAAFSV